MESPPDQGSTINNAASFVDGVVTSEYEQLRLENIRRNQEFLKSLGLDVDGPIVTTRDTAKRRENRRKRSSVVVEVSESIQPMRRSRRLSKVAGETADNEEELYFLDDHEPRIAKPPTVRVVSPEDLENEIDISQERKRITAPMLRQFIIDSNPQHEEEISNEVSTVVSFVY